MGHSEGEGRKLIAEKKHKPLGVSKIQLCARLKLSIFILFFYVKMISSYILGCYRDTNWLGVVSSAVHESERPLLFLLSQPVQVY